jgi:hypothetical protein
MGYTAKKGCFRVRFHTTLKDIAVSVIVLLSCAILCLYGMVRLGMGNPSQVFATYLLAALDSGGTYTLTTGHVERTYLKDLVLTNPKLDSNETTLISAEEIRISGGLPSLIGSVLFGQKEVAVAFSEPTIQFDAHLFNSRQGEGEDSALFSLAEQWLDKNTLKVTAEGMHANLQLQGLSLGLLDASFSLDLAPNRTMPTIGASLGTFTIGYQGIDATLQDAEATLSDTGEVLVYSAKTSLERENILLGFDSLIGRTRIEGFALGTQNLDISLSLETLDARVSQYLVNIPKLSGSVTLPFGTLGEARVSFDRLQAERGRYLLTVPTTTISGRWQEGLPSVALATKQGELVNFSFGGVAQTQARDITANAWYQDPGALRTQIALGSITLVRNDLESRVDDVFIEADASLESGKLASVSASLIADGQVHLLDEDINIDSDLEALVSYQVDTSSLSLSILLPELASSFTKQPLSTRFSFQQNREGSQLQAELSYLSQLSLRAVYDIPRQGEGSLFISSRLDGFPLSLLSPLFSRYAPFLQPYYQDSTNLIGNISFQSTSGGGTVLPFDGKVAIDLALLSAKVGRLEVDAGFTFLSDIKADAVLVDAMTLAVNDYRLVFTGQTELNHWLPRGRLELYQVADGQLLASTTFSDQPPARYRFQASTPLESSFQMEGLISRSSRELLNAEGSISLFSSVYPFSLSLNTSNLQFILTQENRLTLSGNLAPPISATLSTNDFTLPNRGFFANARLSGILDFDFFSVREFSVLSEALQIAGVSFQGRTYTLKTPLSATNNSLRLDDMLLMEGGQTFVSSLSYSGSDFVSLYRTAFFAPFDASFILKAEDEEKIALSLMGSPQRLTATAAISSLPLDRFVPELSGKVVDLTALGSSDLKTQLGLDGTLSVTEGDTSFVSKITADQDQLRFFSSRLSQPDFTYQGDALLIREGKAFSTGTFEHIRHLSYKDQLSNLSYELAIDLGMMNNLFDLPKAIATMLEGQVQADLVLSDILIYGERGFSDGTYRIKLADSQINVEGEHLDLEYDLASKSLSALLRPSFGIGFAIEGSFAPSDFGFSVSSIHFPLALINRTFLKPIFAFLDGTVQGELMVGGSPDAIRLYGQLSVDSSRMELFWLPQDIITMKNMSVTLDGTRGISPRVPFFSTNKITGKTVQGFGKVGAAFDGLRLENYEIHAESGDEMLYVWIPMQGFDADIRTYAGGTFNLFGVGFETWLDGQVMIQDTTMSLGIKDLPFWYVANNLTTTNFDVVTGKNVAFFYPNTPNPFIKATITENQRISFAYDHITDEFLIDGNFSFRSGEIYYFQKNFFITEGSLSLHTDAFTGQSQIQPTINLRAKLTDFDAAGNRVDIFLVLRESGLTNLNPQFESIPSKDVNEILEILGQSILPTGAYGQVNLYSVASLAAAATDVAERLGYLDASQTTQLTESIRISLGLDMFSLRSNILQNILFDALPGNTFGGVLSPLARYLNNTSIFMGKYVGRQFFLQALLHLSAMDRSKVQRSFLSPDLSLDLELSLDWMNPLGTISFFTQPNELSFTNILDTIGFSVTKRIVLR